MDSWLIVVTLNNDIARQLRAVNVSKQTLDKEDVD